MTSKNSHVRKRPLKTHSQRRPSDPPDTSTYSDDVEQRDRRRPSNPPDTPTHSNEGDFKTECQSTGPSWLCSATSALCYATLGAAGAYMGYHAIKGLGLIESNSVANLPSAIVTGTLNVGKEVGIWGGEQAASLCSQIGSGYSTCKTFAEPHLDSISQMAKGPLQKAGAWCPQPLSNACSTAGKLMGDTKTTAWSLAKRGASEFAMKGLMPLFVAAAKWRMKKEKLEEPSKSEGGSNSTSSDRSREGSPQSIRDSDPGKTSITSGVEAGVQ